MKPTSSEWIIVKDSAIHNKGVFACKHVPKGTKVIEYVGDKVDKKEGFRRCEKIMDKHEKDSGCGAVYVFELNSKYDIDGSVSWNTAKWINHSCSPNCEVEIINDRIWIVALHDICEGEEISYDYGYDLEDFEEHPCKCGSSNCCGFIVEESLRPKMKKILEKREEIVTFIK